MYFIYTCAALSEEMWYLHLCQLFFLYRSCLDDHEPFLTTADSAIKLHPNATKPVPRWKGLEYKAAFPSVRPPGANFYPADMDKMVHDPLPFKLLRFFQHFPSLLGCF